MGVWLGLDFLRFFYLKSVELRLQLLQLFLGLFGNPQLFPKKEYSHLVVLPLHECDFAVLVHQSEIVFVVKKDTIELLLVGLENGLVSLGFVF